MKNLLENSLIMQLCALQVTSTGFEGEYKTSMNQTAPCDDCAYRCNGDCSGRCVDSGYNSGK